jgi:predicted Fe-S protein YdhL (DUF1289 family)
MAITSPCTKVCVIDAGSQLCRGCGRTIDEIAQWAALSETTRRSIMSGLSARMAAAGLPPATPGTH